MDDRYVRLRLGVDGLFRKTSEEEYVHCFIASLLLAFSFSFSFSGHIFFSSDVPIHVSI
jgi:hypothetical protein